MALIRWTPFHVMDREMQTLMNRFERLLADTGERFPTLRPAFRWQPTSDVHREDGSLVVRIELAGIDPEKDVEVELTGDILSIRGQKTAEKEVSEEDRYLSERFFGSFERQFAVPEGIDPEAVTATYEAGVLTVRVLLPKEVEKPETKRIRVGTG